MTSAQRTQIAELRRQGRGYGTIAKLLGISNNSVKTFCRRNNLMSADCTVFQDTDTADCHKPDGRTEIMSGNTVFIVTTGYSENASETLEDKLKKLILDDASKQSRTYHFVHE